jgi:hypothetical protein
MIAACSPFGLAVAPGRPQLPNLKVGQALFDAILGIAIPP